MACTGSVAAGITLTMGVATNFTAVISGNCSVHVGWPTLSITGTGLGVVYSAAESASGNIMLNPIEVGSGTMVLAAAGFNTLSVPITVQAASLDIVPGG